MRKNLTPEEKKIYKTIVSHFGDNWKLMLYWLSDKAKKDYPNDDTKSIATIEYSKIDALIGILSASFGLNYRILSKAAMNARFEIR